MHISDYNDVAEPHLALQLTHQYNSKISHQQHSNTRAGVALLNTNASSNLPNTGAGGIDQRRFSAKRLSQLQQSRTAASTNIGVPHNDISIDELNSPENKNHNSSMYERI